MYFDEHGKFKLEKKEFVYLAATVAGVIAAVLYDMYVKRKK